MKWKRLLLTTSAVMFLAGSVQAAEWWRDRVSYERGTEKYLPNEFSVDLFGTYASRDRFGVARDRWGGGLGLNYFPSKYLGVGVDSYLEEWKWPYRVNGSLFFRLPVQELGLAPYAFGGGGREFKYLPQWTAHGGAGLEFRMNRYTGIFADGRRVFSVEDRHGDELDYWLARAGLRLSF